MSLKDYEIGILNGLYSALKDIEVRASDRINSSTGNENTRTCEIVAFIFIVRFADVQAEHISAHFVLGHLFAMFGETNLFLNQI
jgi:hypothetical protein